MHKTCLAALLLVCLLFQQSQALTLTDSIVATSPALTSTYVTVDKLENILLSCESTGLIIYTASGSNTWQRGSQGALGGLIVAHYLVSNPTQVVLNSAETLAFLALGSGGLVVLSISDRSSYSTSSVFDLSTELVGFISGVTINAIKLTADDKLLYVGEGSTLKAYDVSTTTGWTNENISTHAVFGSFAANGTILYIDLVAGENQALLAVGTGGVQAVNTAGKAAFFANNTAATFTLLGSKVWDNTKQITHAISSPDGKFAWVGTQQNAYIISLDGIAAWSTVTISTKAVAVINGTDMKGAAWLSGANYLITSTAKIFDMRTRYSWTLGTPRDLTGQELGSWTLTAATFFFSNKGKTRLYVAGGSTDGLRVMSMLPADGWITLVCTVGQYLQGSDCYPCAAKCETCYDAFSCTSCVGPSSQTDSRVLTTGCTCPNTFYDKLPVDGTANECSSSSCGSDTAINNVCVKTDCFSLSPLIDGTKITLTVSNQTDSSETNYKLLFAYNGTLSTTITAFSTCYDTKVYITSASSVIQTLPVNTSAFTTSAYIRLSDLEGYGCVKSTPVAGQLNYACNVTYVNSFFGESQLTVGATVNIIVSTTTQSTVNITVSQTTATTSCVGCNQVFNIASVVTLVDATNATRANSTYTLGSDMIFKVSLVDPSLKQIYYLKHVTTTLNTSSFSLTLTTLHNDSTTRGVLIHTVSAGFAVSTATISIVCTLETVLPDYTVRRALASNEAQSGSILRAQFTVSIVDPNASGDNTDNTDSSSSSSGVQQSNSIVAIVVAFTGMGSLMMIIYYVYEYSCKVRAKPAKKARRNVLDMYLEHEEIEQSTEKDEASEDEDPKALKNLEIKVEALE